MTARRHDPNVRLCAAVLAQLRGLRHNRGRGRPLRPQWYLTLLRNLLDLPLGARRLHGLLAAAALLLPACNADMSTAAGAAAYGADNSACTAASCGPDLVCHASKWCVAAEAKPEQVVVRIKPPAESGQLTEHFELTIGTKQDTTSHLQLTDAAVVRGSVVRQGELGVGKQWLAGSLVATATSEVEGVTLQYSAKTSAEAKLYPGSPSPQGFELRVQPGYAYQLSFWPEAADKIPPLYAEQVIGASRDDLRIELPAASELVPVEGRLTSDGKPIAGLRVQLDDSSNRQVSTRAVTDAEGKFKLMAGPQVDSAWLRFGPTNDTSGLPKGKLIAACDLAKARKVGQLALGDVELGPVGQPIPVVVQVVGPTGLPEAGATVRLQQQLPGAGLLPSLDGFTEVHGLTDASGNFRAAMPEGPILVQVRPALTSTSGSWQAPVELEDDEDEQAIAVQCPSRHVLTGTLVDAQGQLVRDTDLVLRRESSQTAALLSQSTVGEQPVAARSDASGHFSVPVDDGVWRLWVQPASGAIARALAARVEVLGGDTDLGSVTLPPPIVMGGQIVDAAGKAVVGAVVDVLSVEVTNAIVEAGGSKQTGGQSGATAVLDLYLLGSTSTAAQGVFELLITPTGQAD